MVKGVHTDFGEKWGEADRERERDRERAREYTKSIDSRERGKEGREREMMMERVEGLRGGREERGVQDKLRTLKAGVNECQ